VKKATTRAATKTAKPKAAVKKATTKPATKKATTKAAVKKATTRAATKKGATKAAPKAAKPKATARRRAAASEEMIVLASVSRRGLDRLQKAMVAELCAAGPGSPMGESDLLNRVNRRLGEDFTADNLQEAVKESPMDEFVVLNGDQYKAIKCS
jgi:hypothetical protein